MTNEMLAELIQQGENDKLLPLLWENTSRLIYQKIGIYWRLYCKAFQRYGYELSDLQQEGYMALLYAVKQYDKLKPFRFTTYLDYAIKNTLRSLLNGKTDVLNQKNTESLDQPLSADSDNNEFTLSDTVPDQRAAQQYDVIDGSDRYRALYDAVDSLPDMERRVIHCRYFDEMSVKQSGSLLGISPDKVRRLENNALKLLRSGVTGETLFRIYGDEFKLRYRMGYSRHKGLSAFRTSGSSEVDDYVLYRLYYRFL